MSQRRVEEPLVEETKQVDYGQNWKPSINILELKAANFGMLTFRKIFCNCQESIVLNRRYSSSTFISEEDRGTRNKILSKLAKEIWD